MDDRVEKGKGGGDCRQIQPVTEIPDILNPVSVSRKEGLRKDRVRWTPEAFAPMTEEQVAEFDGSPANHVERPNPI